MSARGSRSEVGFAAALQHDLSVFQPGIMPAGEVIERADGSRLSVHFLGEVPPGEVFKTRRGNTIARAGHGRVVLLGGLHELDATVFAEEATQAGPSIAESLPGAIWTDEPQEVVLEQAKQFLAEAPFNYSVGEECYKLMDEWSSRIDVEEQESSRARCRSARASST